ncbi:MAG: integrase arm-type DNA-binding domain-containing protein [Candidatus Riflebacteria bacterium]|nr:integrase arm-type DNA-binding domain-containing protein [Candidatus Riflebacteria bacterium]
MINPTQIKHLRVKPGCKITKYHDGDGLYLWVYEDGKKWWRFRYRHHGKEKVVALGAWPVVSMKEARELAEKHREAHKRGLDPSVLRKAEKESDSSKTASSFEVIAREWFMIKKADRIEAHRQKIIASLEKDVFPFIGATPITEITSAMLLNVLRRVEERGAIETAHRVRGRCSEIFCYAVTTSRAKEDPVAALRAALRPLDRKHRAAITEPDQVAGLLKAIHGYEGSFVVSCALRLAPLVFVRPGELRQAEWKDVDLEKGEWRYLVTKTQRSGVSQHIVPLSRQAVLILKDIQPLTGSGRYVFPGLSSARPMSNNAVLAALRRMGFDKEEMSGHGFRAMARTILDEVLGFPFEIIEHQLAHAVRDANGMAYNRTKHLDRRREMMQTWADYLDQLRGSKP